MSALFLTSPSTYAKCSPLSQVYLLTYGKLSCSYSLDVGTEYERLKSSNDKNKEGLTAKMLEDIETNNWNINKDFIENLKKEIDEKKGN